MHQQSITKRQPTTLWDKSFNFKSTPLTDICLKCENIKCNGECVRFKEELKKLKLERKNKKKAKIK